MSMMAKLVVIALALALGACQVPAREHTSAHNRLSADVTVLDEQYSSFRKSSEDNDQSIAEDRHEAFLLARDEKFTGLEGVAKDFADGVANARNAPQVIESHRLAAMAATQASYQPIYSGEPKATNLKVEDETHVCVDDGFDWTTSPVCFAQFHAEKARVACDGQPDDAKNREHCGPTVLTQIFARLAPGITALRTYRAKAVPVAEGMDAPTEADEARLRLALNYIRSSLENAVMLRDAFEAEVGLPTGEKQESISKNLRSSLCWLTLESEMIIASRDIPLETSSAVNSMLLESYGPIGELLGVSFSDPNNRDSSISEISQFCIREVLVPTIFSAS